MKKIFLLNLALLAVMVMNATIVTFDFTSVESLGRLGIAPPEQNEGANLTDSVIVYQGITMKNTQSGGTANRIWLEDAEKSEYSLRLYSNNLVTFISQTPITLVQVEWRSSSNRIAELTNGIWNGSSDTVKLTPTGRNDINKIIIITEGDPFEGSDSTIVSVNQALSIGANVKIGTATDQVYSIIGYVSLVRYDDFEKYGDQTFWIADSLGSVAASNEEGGFFVFRGLADDHLHKGDRVLVKTVIKHYNGSHYAGDEDDVWIESVAKSRVIILSRGDVSDTIPVIPPDTLPKEDTIPCVSHGDTIQIKACVSYTWHGNVYTVSGVFSDSLTGAAVNGCDSISTIDLTIVDDCNEEPTEPEDVKNFDWPIITFEEPIEIESFDDWTIESSDSYFSITCDDPTNKGIRIIEGTCKFGTAESYESIPYALQLKPNAALSVSVPEDGYLRIAPHVADRNSTDICALLVKQNDSVLLSKIIRESDKDGAVYPYVYVKVKKGDVKITAPTAGITFHSFAMSKAKVQISDFWNFSDNVFDAWGDTILEQKTMNGLTVNATDKKRCYFKSASLKIEGITFSRYLNLGSTGTESYHSLSFPVEGSCLIEVYMRPSGSDGEDRILRADYGMFGKKADSVVFNNIVRETLHYTGDATTIYLYSENASINIYAIRIIPVESALPFYWNFSEDYLARLDTLKADTTVNGMTFKATDGKRMVVSANKQNIDNLKFTSALKMGGTGAETFRNISFKVNGACKIDIYLRSASSSESRELRVDAGAFGGTMIGMVPALHTALTKTTLDYTGEPTTIYMYSPNSAINIYAIRVRPAVYSIIFKDSGDTGNVDRSGDNVFSTSDFIASSDIPIFAINSHKVSNARMGCGIKLGALNPDENGYIEGYATLRLTKSVAAEAVIFAVAGYKQDETSVQVQHELVSDLTPRTFSQHVVKFDGKNVSELDVRSSATLGRAYVYGITIIPQGAEIPAFDTIQALVSDETLGQVSGGGVFVHTNLVTLLAEPKEGAHFVKWSDEVTLNPRTFAANGNTTLTAIFKQEKPDAIENSLIENAMPCKLLRNGQVLILRGDKTYTVIGQEVK